MECVGEFGNEKKGINESFVFWNKMRFFVLAISLLCLTLLQINSISFNFAVICMADVKQNFHEKYSNETLHWLEENSQKSLVFSVMSIGGLAGLLISVPIIHKIGTKSILITCGICSFIGSVFFPFAVQTNYYFVLICRVFQGLGVSVLFTVIGILPVSWAPTNEASTFLAIASCAIQISSVICMSFSGILCESIFGWTSIYYLFSALTMLSFISFFILFSDDPRKNRFVSDEELFKIRNEKKEVVIEKVPYMEMLADPTVLISWLSNCGGNFGILTLILYGPTYLREVLELEITKTGIASALPFLIAAFLKTIGGYLSDRCTFISEKTRFVICTCISRFGLAIGYLAMASTSNRTIALISFVFSISVSGLNVMGTVRCLQLRCRQYVHFAVSGIALMGYVIQFLAPILVGIICPDNLPSQWSRLFIIIAIMITITNAPFPFIAKAEPGIYTKSKIKSVI